MGGTKLGRLVEVHSITADKRCLDEAYLKISTGLKSIDRMIRSKIDGVFYDIRIEELICMDMKEDVKFGRGLFSDSESESESESEISKLAGKDDRDSVEAMFEFRSGEERSDGSAKAGEGSDVSFPDTRGQGWVGHTSGKVLAVTKAAIFTSSKDCSLNSVGPKTDRRESDSSDTGVGLRSDSGPGPTINVGEIEVVNESLVSLCLGSDRPGAH